MVTGTIRLSSGGGIVNFLLKSTPSSTEEIVVCDRRRGIGLLMKILIRLIWKVMIGIGIN